MDALVRQVVEALTPALLRPGYGGSHPLAGHCYVASEALYHLLGGKDAGWTPEFVRHQNVPHWYLRGPDGQVLDVTAAQFSTTPDYSKGRPKGFLTREPSKRARIVIEKIRREA